MNLVQNGIMEKHVDLKEKRLVNVLTQKNVSFHSVTIR